VPSRIIVLHGIRYATRVGCGAKMFPGKHFGFCALENFQ
jgi:hypothetical protein